MFQGGQIEGRGLNLDGHIAKFTYTESTVIRQCKLKTTYLQTQGMRCTSLNSVPWGMAGKAMDLVGKAFDPWVNCGKSFGVECRVSS